MSDIVIFRSLNVHCTIYIQGIETKFEKKKKEESEKKWKD